MTYIIDGGLKNIKKLLFIIYHVGMHTITKDRITNTKT